MIKKLLAILITTIILYAKDSIIDVSQVLKENQAIVINAKTNTIKYIIEILPNGEMIKTHISKEEKDRLMQGFKQNTTSPNSITNGRKSHIRIWDKKQIIYEQQVEKINIK